MHLRQQLAGNSGVERAFTFSHLTDGANQVGGGGILKEVADGARVERRQNLVVGAETRQNQDVDQRAGLLNLPGGFDPIHNRHDNIH